KEGVVERKKVDGVGPSRVKERAVQPTRQKSKDMKGSGEKEVPKVEEKTPELHKANEKARSIEKKNKLEAQSPSPSTPLSMDEKEDVQKKEELSRSMQRIAELNDKIAELRKLKEELRLDKFVNLNLDDEKKTPEVKIDDIKIEEKDKDDVI